MVRCKSWDSGWCYAPSTKYVNGCVGEQHCEYLQPKGDIPRIDIIGQNGNDGEHYKVEQIARVLAFENMGTEEQWYRFVSLAMKIVEAMDNGKD